MSGVGDFSNISFKWLLPGKKMDVFKRRKFLYFVVLANRKQSLNRTQRRRRGKDVEQNLR